MQSVSYHPQVADFEYLYPAGLLERDRPFPPGPVVVIPGRGECADGFRIANRNPTGGACGVCRADSATRPANAFIFRLPAREWTENLRTAMRVSAYD